MTNVQKMTQDEFIMQYTHILKCKPGAHIFRCNSDGEQRWFGSAIANVRHNESEGPPKSTPKIPQKNSHPVADPIPS